ncbi:MAG: MerR family transcriptional regulator [Anaerolineae bacterium]|mgnify:FL=1|jgi:MerR family transcriptional regulator, light-induced transcriptional regulator|nr:MerR family transcriptional regulator [Anaerolineae bacterium]MBT7072199.1 MerR family transcriptional regulator [Anaerolineae bacterium]MBT7602273.1 MerR family transcriptional regulator [Anaerolineae bacterium]
MNEISTFSLGVILRETGINADTLRAWERRYKLPQPSRSEGGQRLYSPHDIEIIKWLLQRQEEGMRIGQAAKLWHRKIAAGESPLAGDTLALSIDENSPEASRLIAFRDNWIRACISYNEAQAEQVTNEAFTRFPLELVFNEILLPGIREIGELWYKGEISVQKEHFASALLMRRIEAMIAASPAPTRPEKIIVACPPKEDHTLSSLLYTLFLRRRGFHIVYLGTNVPLEQFKETVEVIKPELVLFAAQQLTTAATLEQMVREIRSSNTTVAYSGRIFQSTPDLQDHISAHFLGEDFERIFAKIQSLIATQEKAVLKASESTHGLLLATFEISRAAIQAHLTDTLSQWNTPIKPLTDATEHLSANIAAALYLGDINFLSPELSWVKRLLTYRQMKKVSLERYIQAYANTLQEVIGEEAAPLINWLMAEATN